jgi:hypothetical protein
MYVCKYVCMYVVQDLDQAVSGPPRGMYVRVFTHM